MVSSAEMAEDACVKMTLAKLSCFKRVSGDEEGGSGPLTMISARSRTVDGSSGRARRYGSMTMIGRSARRRFDSASGEGESSNISAVVLASHAEGMKSSSAPRLISAAGLYVSYTAPKLMSW